MMLVDLPKADLPDLSRIALLIVDVQRGFDDTGYWGPRDSPACEDNVAALLAAWRAAGRPDLLVTKTANSCFHGTPDLHAWLLNRELDGAVVPADHLTRITATNLHGEFATIVNTAHLVAS